MLRLLALMFLILAVAVAVTDLAASLGADDAPRLAALGEWWAWLHRDSLLLLQPAVERHISPVLWDPGIQTVLEWPLALELAVLGGVFGLLALWRRRRRQATRSRDHAGSP